MGNNFKMEIECRNKVIRMYEEALKEKDPFMRKVRIAFCVVLFEDKKLLEELAKK